MAVLGGSAVFVGVNRGRGVFDPFSPYSVGDELHHMSVGDVDGDGDADLAVLHDHYFLSVMFNDIR